MKKLDITEQRFGSLIAKYVDGVRNNKTYWMCARDCGAEVSASLSNLKSGMVSSCGCSRRLEIGQAAKNKVVLKYKTDARNNKRNFNLDEHTLDTLFLSECWYCGCEPKNISSARVHGYGDFIYQGIDRLDNDRGYEIDNVVPCCAVCNKAKRDLPLHDFMLWVLRISDNLVGSLSQKV